MLGGSGICSRKNFEMRGYRYTLAMGHLAPGEIFENMLQLKRFVLYFEGILNKKWLLSHRNNYISYRDARGFGDMLPQKF